MNRCSAYLSCDEPLADESIAELPARLLLYLQISGLQPVGLSVCRKRSSQESAQENYGNETHHDASLPALGALATPDCFGISSTTIW